MTVPFAGKNPEFQIDATRNVMVHAGPVGVGVVAGVKWDNGWWYTVLRFDSVTDTWKDGWGWVPEAALTRIVNRPPTTIGG